MPRLKPGGLLDISLASGAAPGSNNTRTIGDETHCLALADLARDTNLVPSIESLRGRTVLLLGEPQLCTAFALLALDGVARRLILGLPELKPTELPQLIKHGEVDRVLGDADLSCELHADQTAPHDRGIDTEWVLFTSGTTGAPKMVVHSLASLTGPIDDGRGGGHPVWSTFYDIRRYGGLQVLLRALLSGGSMVLSSARESVGDYLARAGRSGVTHISGTPSHWRRALMSHAAARMAPRYIRLSGEIADQAILDNLKAAFPGAHVAHAFASTEAGVGFDVGDGLAGFPGSYIGQQGSGAELKIADGTLRVRSPWTALRYLDDGSAIGDEDGFVDTGDLVERRGERYYFLGRREGVINVGGHKIHPEEVEAVLNRHPAVRMSKVWARRNPIIGEVVAADIVLRGPVAESTQVCESLLQACREALPAHKVPVSLRVVSSLDVASSGKLVRGDG